ncbi:MAG TPA: hypothetical protein VGF27_18935 [Pseudoduganella sp.]
MPPEALERRTETLEEAVQQLSCQLTLLSQHVDEGFKAQNQHIDALNARVDKLEARTDARFDKVEAMIEKSEARVMAAMKQLYDQLDKRVDKLETGFRWMIGLQVTTIMAVLGLAARLI